jgi:hypothetical protein
MKKLFSVFLAFLCFMLFNPFTESAFAGTAIKRSGAIAYHNYVQVNHWNLGSAGTKTLTGAAAGTNTDTLILYQDSTGSATPFTTASLRVRSIQADMYDELADSLTYCVLASDDTADVVTLRTEYQVYLPSTQAWFTVGGNGDMALGGAAVKVHACFKRQMLPMAKHRVIAHPSTTTDGAYIHQVDIFRARK